MVFLIHNETIFQVVVTFFQQNTVRTASWLVLMKSVNDTHRNGIQCNGYCMFEQRILSKQPANIGGTNYKIYIIDKSFLVFKCTESLLIFSFILHFMTYWFFYNNLFYETDWCVGEELKLSQRYHLSRKVQSASISYFWRVFIFGRHFGFLYCRMLWN